jgi:hypothetical protein
MDDLITSDCLFQERHQFSDISVLMAAAGEGKKHYLIARNACKRSSYRNGRRNPLQEYDYGVWLEISQSLSEGVNAAVDRLFPFRRREVVDRF